MNNRSEEPEESAVLSFPGVVSTGANGRKAFATVRDLFESYMARTKELCAPRVHEERASLLNLFLKKHGATKLTDLIADDLESFVEGHKEWKSDWTKMRVIRTIKGAFNWAVRKGLTDRNPLAPVTCRAGARREPISDKDFNAMFRGTDPCFQRVLLFLRWTGCRPCEMSALEWPMIDCQAGTATLKIHKTSRTRRDRAPRVIYLTGRAIKLLLWIKRHQAPCERFVFLNRFGNAWNRNSLGLRVYRIRQRLGIPKGACLYGIRHGYATKLAEAGTELATLAALLGHTTVSMASHYVHLAGKTDFLRNALSKGLDGRPIKPAGNSQE